MGLITNHTFIRDADGRCAYAWGSGAGRERCGSAEDRHAQPSEATGGIDQRPHSRACGIAWHPHGPACSTDCPTCGGTTNPEPEPFAEALPKAQGKIDEWVEMVVDDRPDLGPNCPGIDTHPWRLSVFEGHVALTSGCAECDDAVMSPMGGEDVNMDVEIVGRLTSHLETYRMVDSTEYDHWWIFEPTAIGEPDA